MTTRTRSNPTRETAPTGPAGPIGPTGPTVGTRSPSAVPDPDRLGDLLSELIIEHETLLALARDHRDALAHADAARLGDIVAQTGQVLGRIRSVETERQRLVARPDGTPSTMDELLRVADAADRTRLSDRATTLRHLVRTVQAEHEAVRVASEALASHMRGLMQQVASKLSHAGTYGRAGRVAPVGAVVTGVDIGA
jgi:hypothetical protein